MFVHQSQLRHLLQPHHYTDEGWYRAELERLFRPAWHVVGTKHDLARPGDYLTLDLCGEPVLVRNEGGDLVAFQNVCAHRHCTVRSEPKGNQPRLACQYHGWEYTKEGRTGRIPDAGCFRPWDREHACLKKFRVDTVGELVLVSLAPEGPGVREFLGPLYPSWESGFDGKDFRLADAWEHDFDCNWKVVVENSLESYHIPCIHPKTFKDMPEEPTCEHVLDQRYTTFVTRLQDNWINRRQAWSVRRLGMPVTNNYTHQNVHPNTTFSSLDVHRLAMIVYPLSAHRSRYRVWVYTVRGRKRNPFARGLAAFLRLIVKHVARKVYWEDGHLYPAIQQGLQASTHTGVIGTREERIYYFQKHVLDSCAGHVGNGAAALPTVG
jgi:choline monooxygenase